MSKTIKDAIGEMIKENRVDQKDILTVPVFVTEDMYLRHSDLFSEACKKALDNICNNMVVETPHPMRKLAYVLRKIGIISLARSIESKYRSFSVVHAFGVIADDAGELKAMQKLANTLNDLSSKKCITHTLSRPAKVKLNDGRSVYVAYVALNDAGIQYAIKAHPTVLFSEGGLPQEIVS